ncbi:DNA recombination protein RmuC [Rhodococcus sp. BP-252]|uniref:DNA recombinase n=1 Tax=Rhodococcoides kyotonense TaxID=398843 RepID=A0A177YBI4_9NOCA|nr:MULTISPECIES: DNA recombination protein RmuC [Rhodococcus]MBY6411721.1 DNA recombination protein RmuC [Rhodococcus sp. BP-320]MBY6417294.1 DNA recombination protein RmuC [Rhodococcus sp. BP-321]MBY6421921.1 DNA recombination protein RmuC [Rhodococcus sp. BP-324]MBY6427318.1 DNA recombination protein RmuC [Rhodococcus sp. BP-323]MBY6432539.1 DNA recombination protein RmuC [Rhodococcus sp. BP-322]
MNVLTALGMAFAFALGGALGWLMHAQRVGDRAVRAEAQLAALRDNEALLRRSLAAVNEDSARRHSGVIGQQVSSLVEPLHDAVDALTEHVRQVEHNRIRAYAGLTEQVSGMHRASVDLSTQTSQLVTALRAPQIRGRWGEMQLERVVELAGMVKHCDFDTQVSREGIRPDMIVHLAGGRQIVVDAKVPFAAYLDAAQEQDPDARARQLTRHARHLRTHVDQLSAKEYWRSFEPTPEFVVLFVPGDPFLDAALTSDSSLLEYAFTRNVILATPTTLVALLRTVAYSWKQESLAEDAARIQQLGRELYSRLGTVASHLDKLGGHLGKAVESFNSTVSSVDSRVGVTARKLHELELFDGDVVDVRRVDARPRLSDSSYPSRSFGHVDDAVG